LVCHETFTLQLIFKLLLRLRLSNDISVLQNEIVAGYSWKNKKLDPTFMNAAKGKELLPRLVQVNKCLLSQT
jgi:hypothetical protein